MKITDLLGREKSISLTKYLIDWDSDSLSKVQKATKIFLKNFWVNDLVTEEFTIPGSRLSCDFLNWSKLISIEVDGRFHDSFSKFHHKNRLGFLASSKRDMKKDQWLEANGFLCVRIPEGQVKNLTSEWFLATYGVSL